MEDWEYINDRPRPTFAKVQTLIACGQKDFTRANLIGLDLRELDLSGLDFTEACMIGATIRDLSGSNLTRADLSNANLVTANCENADFSGANLEGANLRGAILRGAILHCRLFDANLAFADLRNAKINPHFGCRGNDLSDIILWQTYLPNGKLFASPWLTTGYDYDFPEEFR